MLKGTDVGAPSARAVLVAALALAGFAACSGPGNTGQHEVPDALAEQIPWVNGRQPARDDDGNIIVPTDPQYPPIRNDVADLDPVPEPDCELYAMQTEGLEFSTDSWFETFEPGAPGYPGNPRGAGATVGVAEAWAMHDDKTEGSFTTPGELNDYSNFSLGKGGAVWGIPAEKVPGPRCGDDKKKANDWTFHFKGGRYNRYGAGVEHPLAAIDPAIDLYGCPLPDPSQPPSETNKTVVCPPDAFPDFDTSSGKSSAGIPLKPTLNDNDAYAQPGIHRFWDVSHYDGIGFWARRGPEGQGALTIVIQDQHTSSDLNKENNTFCDRYKPCWSKCLNRAPCTENLPDEPGVYRCFDPALGSLASASGATSGTSASLLDMVAPRCGKTACSSPSTYTDPDFDGKTCRAFTFGAHESGEYCFNDDDPDPPDTGYRCGDGYAKEVTVTPYWKYYKVRFSELRQQGFGKPSPEMDLHSISAVAFLVAVGWADFYLDNVSFYREAR